MKKLMALALSLLMLALPVLALGETVKDETVYAKLAATGDVLSVLVVSHLDTPEAGEYVDYGAYTRIAPLTEEATPLVDGDAITWTLPANPEGFFAMGEMEDAALPFAFALAYTLDGAAVTPEDLAGQSGRVTLTLKATANPEADAYLRAHYMAQVQVPLSLASASNIDAPGATSTLVGQALTLAYTVLPGQDAAYTLSFDATDFAMDGLTIACAPMDIEGMLGLNIADVTGQTQTLVEGADSLAEGGQALTDGLQTLADGVGTLSTGAASLADGTAALESGLTPLVTALSGLPGQVEPLATGAQTLADGVSAYVDGTATALDGVSGLTGALDTLSTEGAALAEAVSGLQTGLAPLLAQLPDAQKAVLEAQLGALTDGVTTYTQGVSTLSEQAGALDAGIATIKQQGTALASGMQQQADGLQTMTASLGQLGTQTAALPGSLASLTEGAQQLSGGVSTLNTQVQALPAQAQTLADGQKALAEGIGEAIALLDEMPITADGGEDAVLRSFASPDHGVRSVQFVYMTDAIAKEAPAKEAPADDTPKTFWERLTALF